MKFFLLNFSLLLITVTLLTVPKVDAAEPKQLVNLRKGYTDARHKALAPITKKYHAALVSLRKRLARDGNLEAALIVKSEEDGINKTEEANQPKDLVRINRIYNHNCDRESAKITQKYVKALKIMQDKLTRAGHLQDALMVKKEYEKYTVVAKSGPDYEVINIGGAKALKLIDGAKPWTNENFVFANLPKELKGMSYYQYKARSHEGRTIKVHRDCEVKIIVGGHKVDLPALEKWVNEGWEREAGNKLIYTDTYKNQLFVLSKKVKFGVPLKILDYSEFAGIIVLVKEQQ